jgi:hypothetical protein
MTAESGRRDLDEAVFVFDTLKNYCEEHGYADVPFWKQLLDDLYIAKNTSIHPMYANIRQLTQNAQTA